ncbi:FAD-dependent monooxygenase [Duganella violaceipulchra]|uniref:2-polyprenyl-6-methoxyphenol hydroxylase-like FAD-dependent oxidoreductase n=1 Tax=Duganella violaceipulchra TaxID=2849652 RepID=A0AA41H9U5_9BURK|nr:FAD-dependent monooxygenase [Duganella violaceicalia]MBV6319838.1 FAD-dependent monooxygenase [Duganella violaceicalia]MCP2006345.1 2-polyprenyl-6-methoxyphenol hydroxylase-like FAD-dependent oxidoreductase [Duganella violaceicalia]
MAPQVLIVGAGPTGLVLAIRLARHGVGVRIIDKNSGPGQASRAMAVHARTLEFYRQLGFADVVVNLGIKIEAIHLREGGEDVAELPLKDIGAGLSPYPFVLAFPQDDHERFLVEQLKAMGVEVEWNTELESFTQDEWGVRAVLERDGDRIACSSAYLCGCDGARSRVRESLKFDFSGGTYEHLYYVADVKTSGPENRDLVGHLGANTFALMLPVRSRGMQRLIGILPPQAEALPEPNFEDVRPVLEPLLGIKVEQVNWFSTYRVHHRVASQFRSDRCFLGGDAAHIHSPAGGQGMNTGIGDAVNLSWKLAQVLQGRAESTLLDTYQAERIVFARKLVATTDRAFQMIVSQGAGGQLLRGWLMPHVFPVLAGFAAARRTLFKTLSQVQIHYPDSHLSAGRAGDVIGGDRLPWVPQPDGEDNFSALQTLDWQLHVYGQPSALLGAAAREVSLPLHVYPWSDAADDAGLLRDAAYLIRPDMHVALALPRQELDTLRNLVERYHLRFAPAKTD